MTWISATPLHETHRALLSTSPEFPKAALHFEVGKTNNLIAHRISLFGETVALIRLDDWWDWLWVGFGDFPQIFEHLRASSVDTANDDPVTFVRDKMLKNPALFGRADFVVESLRLFSDRKDARRPILMGPDVVTDQPWVKFETTGVIPLRKASEPNSGRVKWFRKLAREGRLPPVFLYHHIGLISWLVIDGHDRLLAAQLEGITPRFVGVSSVRLTENPYPEEARQKLEEILAQQLKNTSNPKTIDGINRRLISLYEGNDWLPFTRGVKLVGGLERWATELRRLSLPSSVF